MAGEEDFYTMGKLLSPVDEVARGLRAPGPFAPALTSKDPETNVKNIGDHVNPAPAPPVAIAGPLAPPTTYNPLTKLFQLAGQADVNMGIKTPEQAASRAEGYGQFTRDLGLSAGLNAVIPGAGLVPGLARMGGQAALGGVTAAMEGKPAKDIALATSLGLIGQTFGGEMAGQGAKFARNQQVGGKLLEDYAQASKQAGESNAAKQAIFESEKARIQGLNAGAKRSFLENLRDTKEGNVLGAQAHEAMRTLHAERASADIVNYLKQQAPDLADLPGGTRGILEIVYGKGQEKLSAGFDAAMKDLLEKAKGKTLDLSPEAAKAFGLKSTGMEVSPQVRELLKAAGREPPPAGYDAGDVIPAILGKWKKDPAAYREVVDALSDAGLTNPKAEGYKAAQGIMTFLDKTGSLEGERLNPDKVLAGMTELKTLNELRRRGQGNIFEGPLQSVRGGPGEFRPQPLPQRPIPESLPTQPIPVSVDRPDVQMMGPLMKGHPYMQYMMGAAPAAAAAHALGAGGLSHYGPAAVAGGLLSKKILGSEFVKKAPLSFREEEIMQMLPVLSGALSASGLEQYR